MGSKSVLATLSLFSVTLLSAQSNSPYSRYGIGDLVPQTNLKTRAMGGITAGYADVLSVNFNNPASYAAYLASKGARSNKLDWGRVVIDAGINLENRSLIEPNTTNDFTSSGGSFSYFQVGFPLRRNWGLTFGIRPVSQVSYKVQQHAPLYQNGVLVDSNVTTQFNGTGGSYLPSLGTGFSFGKLSLGLNVGYLFGRREVDNRRYGGNDSVAFAPLQQLYYYAYGSLFYTFGAQYLIPLKGSRYIRLGASGNLQQTLQGTRDYTAQTFVTSSVSGAVFRIDSVYERLNTKGEVVYPASYTAGFVFGSEGGSNASSYLFGIDYSASKWSNYRFFNQADSVQDSWKLSLGGQFNPKPNSHSYFSNVAYRAGLFFGEDYVKVGGNNMPLFGASLGMSLPIRLSRQAPNQINTVNLAFEFIKRGNNSSLLKENTYRLSVGFNFTDLWFLKRKYE